MCILNLYFIVYNDEYEKKEKLKYIIRVKNENHKNRFNNYIKVSKYWIKEIKKLKYEMNLYTHPHPHMDTLQIFL